MAHAECESVVALSGARRCPRLVTAQPVRPAVGRVGVGVVGLEEGVAGTAAQLRVRK